MWKTKIITNSSLPSWQLFIIIYAPQIIYMYYNWVLEICYNGVLLALGLWILEARFRHAISARFFNNLRGCQFLVQPEARVCFLAVPGSSVFWSSGSDVIEMPVADRAAECSFGTELWNIQHRLSEFCSQATDSVACNFSPFEKQILACCWALVNTAA